MLKLDNSLGFLLSRVSNMMRKNLENRLAPFDLTAAQWAAMMRLKEHEPLTVSELAQSLYFDKPTTTGVLGRLQKKKLIKRLNNQNDARSQLIMLTQQGKSLVAETQNYAQAVNQLAMKNLSEKQIEQLTIFLVRILED